MYSAVKGATVLPVTSDTGTYQVRNGVGLLESIDEVPVVDVVATRSMDGKTLTLLCVNRSLERDVPVNVVLDGMVPVGSIGVLQLSASSRYERNDEVEPQHVMPQRSSLKSPIAAHPLAITLPHESVTRVQIALQ